MIARKDNLERLVTSGEKNDIMGKAANMNLKGWNPITGRKRYRYLNSTQIKRQHLEFPKREYMKGPEVTQL